MIYFEMFLFSTLFFVVGMYCGVKYSIQVLNKKYLEQMGDEAVNKALKTASSIRNLCEEFVYRVVKATYPFPYNSDDIKSHIERKINLN